MKPLGWFLTTLLLGLSLGVMMVSQAVLMPFIIGLILAYILGPLVDYQVRAGLPRALASALPVAVAIILLGVLLAFALPLLVQQLLGFLDRLPGYMNQLQDSVIPPRVARYLHLETLNNEQLLGILASMGQGGASWLAENIQRFYNGAMALVNIILLIIMTPLVAFYLMHDWPQLQPRLLKMLPRSWRATTVDIVTEIDIRLAAYLRGQMLVCLVLAVFYGTALEMIDLELGWALGALAGLLGFIPVVGAMVGLMAMLGMTLIQYQMSGWEPYALVAAIYIVGQILESSVLIPNLVGNRIGLHPIWVIFALLVGGELGGIMGMLLALPMAVIISVVLPYVLGAWHKAVR